MSVFLFLKNIFRFRSDSAFSLGPFAGAAMLGVFITMISLPDFVEYPIEYFEYKRVPGINLNRFGNRLI